MNGTMADDYHCPDAQTVQELKDIANKLRIHSIESTNAAKSGHPTSCCSAAEIMSVLFFNVMKYDVQHPRNPNSDRFVMSKGHAAPILYAAWAEAGLIKPADLLKLRKIDNDLEGHPTPRLEFVDVATGSLGQGLSCAAGMAYTGKYFEKANYRVYCMMGDGESAEGSVWEALNFASFYKLDNLVAIFDVNRLGQSDPTALQHDLEAYKRRLDAFGFNTYIVDGHDVEGLCKAFHAASTTKNKPSAIVAKTFKGHLCPGIEDQDNWHGKPLGDKAEGAIKSIRALIHNNGGHKLCVKMPTISVQDLHIHPESIKLSSPPNYKIGDKIATRQAYGTALVKLGETCPQVVALDADVKNSTFSIEFHKKFPDRFIECYIAEQNMVGVGIGCGTRGRTIPFVSTFACFLSRAFDQIRMGGISMANVKFCGSHVGVSIGEDGPSQMALEDLAMFRALPNSVVFYPTDAVACERAVELAAKTTGICYIRTGRPALPVIYKNDEQFQIGKAKILRQSANDKVLLIGAGVTLYEALKAADQLHAAGIEAAVIDPFTIRPLDAQTITAHAQRVGGNVVVVEDHYAAGGIGEAVAGELSLLPNIRIRRLVINELPRSGQPEELLDRFGISAPHIVAAAKEMLGQ